MSAADWIAVAFGLSAHAGAIIFGVGRVLLRHELRISALEVRLSLRRGAVSQHHGNAADLAMRM